MVLGKKRLAQWSVWVGLAFISGACGGRAQSSGAPPQLQGGGGNPSSEPALAVGGSAGSLVGAVGGAAGGAGGSMVFMPPGPSQGGAGGEAPVSMACSESAPVLGAELVWQDSFVFYGSSDFPFMGFSPDGAQLIVPISEAPNQQGNRSYGVANGALLAQPPPAVLSRDAAWSRQLLSLPGALVQVGDVAEVVSGQALLSFKGEPPGALQVRLSDDGQFLFRVKCQEGLRVERLRISDGEVSSVPLGSAESLCVGYGHPAFIVPLAASRSNDRVLVGAERRGIALADFASGTAIFTVPPDDASAATRKPNQPLPSDALTLELAPTERTLATIDASGTLRLSSYPELVQSTPGITTAVSSAFANGYVTRRALAPIAWSPDERYLATADDSHATVVRRACDGSVAITLPPPVLDLARPDDDQHWAPAFLAFNRQGHGLAVLRVNEKFRGTVSYYSLSPAAQD